MLIIERLDFRFFGGVHLRTATREQFLFSNHEISIDGGLHQEQHCWVWYSMSLVDFKSYFQNFAVHSMRVGE